MLCPLCHAPDGHAFHRDARRAYLRCGRCRLVFVPPEALPDAASERARYELHRNDAADEGYRRFLSQLAEPLLEVVPVGAEGLDFGCGPTPVLAQMLRERGRPTRVYDPFFAPDDTVWHRRYDFIAVCEVLEHVHHPADIFDRLFAALQPRGVLAIMTRFAPPSEEAFAAWHYIRDPTHVRFYAREVFSHIAERWRASASYPAPDVVLLSMTLPSIKPD